MESRRAVVVPGTGWPRGTETKCSTINKTLLERAVQVAGERESVLIALGGVGKTKDGQGMTESERARHYLAEKGLVADVMQGPEAEAIAQGVRSRIEGALAMRTDCDPDFDGNPSRDSNENGINLVKIIDQLAVEGMLVDDIHVVAMEDHADRVLELFEQKLEEAGYGDLPLNVEGVPVDYEPDNAQWHLRARKNRLVWEMISAVYRRIEGQIGKERLAKFKNQVKKKLGLI